MTDIWLLIAQATQPGGEAAPQGGNVFMRMIIPIILMVGVFYWIMIRGQRKERHKHASMLNAMKRNDRVQTIGGIIGTVVDVRDNEVVLKVDENSNVKMHFNRGAIKEVLTEAPAAGGGK
jgi:preprotein translocase subunit YajC